MKITKNELSTLNDIYCKLWIEAYYDSCNEHTQKFAEPLAQKMSELNKTLKFKK